MVKLIIGVVVGFFMIMLCVMSISYLNKEVMLRTTINAKQVDNTSEFDNMYKKISQVAQVTSKEMESLKDIFISHALARTSGDNNSQIMTWIKESIPNIDTLTFKNLQNIIVGSRDSWTMRQKELIALKTEHDQLLQLFPSNLILSMFGRRPIDITVITSSRTVRVFEDGKDDDVKLF